MDEKIDKQGWKHQIACRTRFKDLYKAIDLPRMILQIVAATDGDAIIVSVRHPRATVGRFSFRMNIHLLVGFFFIASEIFYILILNEHLDPENRTLLILFLISGFMMYFLMLELSLRIPRRLPQQERRRAHLIGWLQEGLMILVLVPIVCWMLQEPVVTLMPTPT